VAQERQITFVFCNFRANNANVKNKRKIRKSPGCPVGWLALMMNED
jgi:hypothetical protein